MENFKKEYRDLELKVFQALRTLIDNSKHISKHVNEKAVKVNLFDYEELTLINNRLTFLDRRGYQYSLYTEYNLEDLIEILNSNHLNSL